MFILTEGGEGGEHSALVYVFGRLRCWLFAADRTVGTAAQMEPALLYLVQSACAVLDTCKTYSASLRYRGVFILSLCEILIYTTAPKSRTHFELAEAGSATDALQWTADRDPNV